MLGAATPAMTVVAPATASPVLSPGQLADRNDMFSHVAHLSCGQGSNSGWGFEMAVRTHRGDYAPVGRFAWFGGTGTTAYADSTNQLTGILLTQVGPATPDAPRAMNDFWITVYQAIDRHDLDRCLAAASQRSCGAAAAK